MMVMLANNSGKEARRLAAAFPGRIGHLYGPGGWRGPFPEFPHALDNGAFSAFSRGVELDAGQFLAHCDKAHGAGTPPRWVAVPDVVCDRDRTLASWKRWAPELRQRYGWPLAFVVQNGMTAGDVPTDADVVFVGGDTRWKWETVTSWCAAFPRVHVGRVNSQRLLWLAHRAGAESCDGTGWFRGNRKQLDGLWYYLADVTGRDDTAHGPMQPRLFALGAPEAA